jgi:chromosome segregation ATPase
MPELDVLVALASNAAVAAAASDAWEDVRHKLARLMGRGDLMREQLAEQRLDETRQQLGQTDSEAAREFQARRWQARFADLLDEYPDLEGDLRALVEEIQAHFQAEMVSGADHTVAAGRDVNISASGAGLLLM